VRAVKPEHRLAQAPDNPKARMYKVFREISQDNATGSSRDSVDPYLNYGEVGAYRTSDLSIEFIKSM